ncbi:hypothetical protein GXM_01189 [Nostoc sphaeroides CCNUC1]|uniref:Uncharacterized protein n=1 Tax=Nostoc sphaeroides CCNUC1 TaxID=2653204 RepID=A0A5P8VUA2_9NOSO|nr:hypothetical protein GXM_01189 [Nostoc sphaeroides CCNUC1]
MVVVGQLLFLGKTWQIQSYLQMATAIRSLTSQKATVRVALAFIVRDTSTRSIFA